MKKSLSVLLALVMTLALAIPAFFAVPVFAAQTSMSGGTVEAAQETVAPTITMTMPTGVVIGLNPYGMTYNGATTFLKNLKGLAKDQILSVPAIVENKSDVRVSVSAKATATLSSGVSIVSGGATINSGSAFPANDFAKHVYLKMQLGKVNDKTNAQWSSTPTEAVFTKNATSDKDEVNYVDAIQSGGASGDWFIKSGGALVTFTEDATIGRMKPIILDATDGKVANYFAFKFTGAANSNADPAWTTADTLSVSVVFSFKPLKIVAA